MKKTTITFVTGNKSKFEDVQRYLNQLDPSINLVMEDIDVPEIQSLDVDAVAHAKAQAAWNILKKPLLIDDGGIYLERFNQFPGTLSKYVAQAIGLEGVWLLAKDNPRAFFIVCLVYIEGPASYKSFKGVMPGRLVMPTAPVKNPYFPYTEIFIPEGSEKIYADLRAQGEVDAFSHRRKAIIDFVNFLKAR